VKKAVFILFIAVACVPLAGRGQVNIIKTIAGQDTAGFSGDNGLALNCKLYLPSALCLDKWNNIYVADALNNRVRKINSNNGIITTIAGCCDTAGYSGDNGLAVNANLFIAEEVRTDTLGNIYIVDEGNNRIRKITASTGIITTIAGNGSAGSGGDNGPATDAELYWPSSMCIDKFGNIIIADYQNDKVRKIDAVTGIITTIAGTGVVGYSGDNGLAINATFDMVVAVFADTEGNIFIGDQWNGVVRKITISTGIITTIAGTGVAGYSGDHGPATNAQLTQVTGLYIDKTNNIYVADYGTGTIRRIDALTGIITTVAGNGTLGYSGDNGPATDAELKCSGMFLDDFGTMYIADYSNNRIRKVYYPTAIKELQTIGDLKIYPNPTAGKFTVQTTINKHYSIDVCNVVGEHVYHAAFDGTSAEVDITGAATGVYFVYLGSGDEKVVRKVCLGYY
jgi:hypothetical protein